jgi:hypothetical protein
MIVCKLKCGKCDYESAPFVEGYSVHSDSHTVLCKNRGTNTIRIAELKNKEIGEDAETDSQIEAIAVCDDEEVLKTNLGVEERLGVPCPVCGNKGLDKIIVGVQ